SSDYYTVSTSGTSSSSQKHIYLVAQEGGSHTIYWKNYYSSSSYAYYLRIYNLTTDTTIRSSSYSNTYSTSYYGQSFTCNAGDVIVISLYRYSTSYYSYAYFYFTGFYNTSTVVASGDRIFSSSYQEDSTATTTATFDGAFTLPEISKTGYTFLGWYNEDDEKVEGETWTIAADTTLTPKWQVISNTITLDANGGTVESESVTATYGEVYTLPEPTRAGYTFGGWFLSGSLAAFEDGVEWELLQDITLTAKWTANTYTVTYSNTERVKDTILVTYDYNHTDSTPTTVTLTNGQTLTYPTMPVRSGYVFTGWYTDSACTTKYAFNGAIAQDITLYAGWFAMNNYSSNYNQRTQIEPYEYGAGSDYTPSTSSTSSSYKNYLYFVAEESKEYEIWYANYNSGTSYAYYLQIYNVTANSQILSSTLVSSQEYTELNFECNAGDIIVISLYRYNTSYSSTAYIYFEGFTAPTSTATASCYPKPYAYAEDKSVTMDVTFDSNFTLYEITRDGYTFDGWYNGETKIEDGAWEIASDVTLTAKWVAIETEED
ncbi:MAG: InlB B-repeat-containing protein, partial [Clostridia bacterium]|nr:InlB B-repeat-containing protein [Clostridia bacterium]